MPNPKRRHSHSRQAKRRANWNYQPGNPSACPQCKEPKLPHQVCPHCGFYRGVEVIPPRKEE
jgi:large subunit ribosomal protein L32